MIRWADFGWAGARKRAALPCSLCAVPPSQPARPSAGAAVRCENSSKGSRSGDLSALLGVLPADPLAPRQSGPLGTLDSSTVTTSFTLCVASEQPAGCNYRIDYLGLLLQLTNTYSRLTQEGEGILFLNVVFQARAFAPQWTGSAT